MLFHAHAHTSLAPSRCRARRLLCWVVALCWTLFLPTVGGADPIRLAPPEDVIQLLEYQFRPQVAEARSLIRAGEMRARYGVSGAGLTVAVIDSGLRTTHADFAGRVAAQVNFTEDNGGDPTVVTDTNGHGTQMGGIILANGLHTGVAPGASIIPLKVIGAGGDLEELAQALQWVIDHRAEYGISAVSLSLGISMNYTAVPSMDEGLGIRARIQALRAARVPVVVAAGNAFYTYKAQGMDYPAIVSECVSASAVYDADIGPRWYASGASAPSTGPDRICPFAQRLHESVSAAGRTDVFAPGDRITSAGISSDSGSASSQGTSGATAVTAGVILLLQEYALRMTGALPTVDDLETWLRTGVTINDGDDEDDNVPNTGLDFVRVDCPDAVAAGFPPLPDLVIESVTPSKASVATGEAFDVAVTVRNQGDAAAGAFTLGLFRNAGTPPTGPGAGDVGLEVPGLAAAETVTCTFAGVSYSAAGDYHLWVLADSAGAVPESIEANNHGPAAGQALHVFAVPARLGFLTQPVTTPAGSAITPAVRVVVLSESGEVASDGTFAVTLALGENPRGGTLSGTATVGTVNGVATFSDLCIDRATSLRYTLEASAAGLAGATSAGFLVVVGAPAKLAFVALPTLCEVGRPLAPAVQVAVLDAGGNRVWRATNAVTLSLAAAPAGAAMAGTTMVEAVAGSAAFADLSLDKPGNGYTLAASAPGLAGATSGAFAVAGPPARLAFAVQPRSTTAGKAFAPAVRVVVQDAEGRAVSTSGIPIDLSVGVNTKGAAAFGTTTVSTVNGAAVFTDLNVRVASGVAYHLVAEAEGLASAASASFTISAAAPARLAFVVQPRNTLAGQPLSPALRVVVQDGFGNTASRSAVSITLALGANPGNAHLAGTTTRLTANGAATFTGLSLDQASSDSYTLTAAAAGLQGATSAPFRVLLGTPTRLVFLVQPGTTAVGAAMAPAVQVMVVDAGGNRVASASHSISLGMRVSPSGGALVGTRTAGAVNGIAVFPDVRVSRAGSGYILGASAAGLTPGASQAFAVEP